MHRLVLVLAVGWLGIIGPAMAQDRPGNGQAAFEAGDYALAEQIWRREAETGQVEALLGLGFLHDLGLGMSRDPHTAFRFYAEAAEAGLPEAAFNIGVMLDSGTGVRRSAEAAATWYSRAAAAGHTRAQYNLGLLYATGEGVPRNPDLARYWLDLVSDDVSAAGDRLTTLPPVAPEDRTLSAPVPLTGALLDRGAVLVWTAPPGPEDMPYRVQVIVPDGTTSRVEEVETYASAIEIPLAETARSWRVMRVDEVSYAASPWRSFSSDGTGFAPTGRVQFLIDPADLRAEELATRLAGSLSAGGLTVGLSQTSVPSDAVGVRYGFRPDAALAGRVAAFLPGLAASDIQLDAARGLEPGEIQVALRFRAEARDQSAR